MPQFAQPVSLRAVLIVDAATCALMGAVLSLGARLIADLTGLAPALLAAAGMSLLPIAAFMAFVASRPAVPPLGAWLVIAGNAMWVAGSVVLLAPQIGGANAIGIAFIAAQALAVAALTWLEWAALRGAARPSLA